jgi:hypothetical protein
MGKASSSKKVARAARAAASSRPGERRNLGFPLVVAAIVVLGIGLVVFARSTREASAAPRIGQHWHSSYDVFVCDDYVVEPVEDQTDPVGIHTHSDGLIHIHPFSSTATGDNARLSVWFEAFGGSITDESITLDGGRTFTEGEDCNGEPTVLHVLRYDADDLDARPEVITEDLADVRFLKNREAFVFAFIPEGAELPEPSQGRLDTLDRVDPEIITEVTTTTAGEDGGDASTTTAAEDTPTEDTAAEDEGASTTTAAG